MAKRKSLTQQIVEKLTEEVRDGALRPGDRIPNEFELAESMNVSRSTVREAAMHGKESFLWNRHFRTESTCHEVTDLAVLRLKFSNVQNEAFDLRALDATDQTEPEPFVPSTGGNSYGVGGYYVPNYGSDLNAWDNFLDVVKIVGAVAGAVLVIWGVIRLAPVIAAVKAASKK